MRSASTLAFCAAFACSGAPSSSQSGASTSTDAGATTRSEGDVTSSEGDVTSGEGSTTTTASSSSTAMDASSTESGSTGGDDPRGSLAICWTDATCPRVLAVAHGGMWSVTGAPYDSNAALVAAYEGDVDGVKIDVRVTMDDVPVIAHSSPIEYYESLDCGGRRIEEMTADEVVQCHRFPSATETFQRLDDVLDWVRGKMVVQLTVKLSTDYARTIADVHAKGAEDFAFLEISPSELQDLIPTIAGADGVYYLVNVGTDVAQVDTLIDTIANPRAFMYELDPTVDVSTLTTERLHPAGVRSFTYTDAAMPSEPDLQALFEGGFDVVSAQAAESCVAARKAVNERHGVSPP